MNKLIAMVMALSAAVATAEVSVTVDGVSQRWPWSKTVDVRYTVSGAEAPVDIQISATANGGALQVPVGGLAALAQGNGSHLYSWDPSPLASRQVIADFTPTLTVLAGSPAYMIVDLDKTPGEEGQLTFISEDDLHSGAYGSVETNLFDLTGLAWTGITNEPWYAACTTSKMAFRRIRAGTVQNKSGNPVTVDRDFYEAVFELTEAQWRRITGQTARVKGDAYSRTSVVSYNALRGAKTDEPTVDWPTTGMRVSPDSIVGRFRHMTGFLQADIPSAAQWEYACRAGSSGTTLYNNGKTEYALDDIAQPYADNTKATKPVGGKLPNAWGLYDTIGNVNEWALDADPSNTSRRQRRGGSFYGGTRDCSTVYGGNPDDTDGFAMNGARLVINVGN